VVDPHRGGGGARTLTWVKLRGMARTIWKGSLSFGLVNVPVGLYPATAEKTIRFHQFEAGTADRIRYKKVNERTGDEVDNADIVRGVDLGGGDYVLLSDEELAAAEPVRSRLIEITDFVDLTDIDPVYFRATYYLAPEGEAAEKAYALLRAVMGRARKIAIGTLVMRNKEYPVAIRPDTDVLLLETLYFADEIRRPDQELPGLPHGVELSDKETAMAELLVQSMESPWDPARYEDTHRAKVEALIEEKRQGHEIVTEAPARAETKVVDLMEALSASIDEARAKGTAPRGADKAPAKRATRAATVAKPAAGARAKKAAPKPRRTAS
jgi:DNA end-binding protein Ku